MDKTIAPIRWVTMGDRRYNAVTQARELRSHMHWRAGRSTAFRDAMKGLDLPPTDGARTRGAT